MQGFLPTLEGLDDNEDLTASFGLGSFEDVFITEEELVETRSVVLGAS